MGCTPCKAVIKAFSAHPIKKPRYAQLKTSELSVRYRNKYSCSVFAYFRVEINKGQGQSVESTSDFDN